jgi:acetyl-CoA C-acetyltransferase
VGACDLGAVAIKEAISRAHITDKTDLIDEVLMGNVLSAGLGQAPAAITTRLAGLPLSIPSTTINKVCASGMKAIMLAATSIRARQADIIVVGGMESMSKAPHILQTARTGSKFGDQTLIDSLRLDGLTDSSTGWGMGLCGEKCAEDHNITRQMSDDYAKRSYEKAIAAKEHHAREIVGVQVPLGKETTMIAADEGPKNVDQ